jgi:hypothetical protein
LLPTKKFALKNPDACQKCASFSVHFTALKGYPWQPRASLFASSNGKKQSLYQLDYSVSGKRIRTTVGPNKKDAELVRAKIQSDLILGRRVELS